ncbi:hypothetical protein PF002_g15122 [Phytophthora fragariae]|uniref:Uncharacterized protein n=1 Tax=Phytophthora fragariae TaxID=53985 RepID=A0A6A3YRR8_9STRA|nr:hypothetical protein PF003_g31241 [Phytophthora fragariae]KAE9221722.1 hypothetical protein PF004_g12975 [Phytophthora fragariae]KAE9222886.1 hypothetical protein PF002_g15122 [Phytophthora fragariae]
MKWSDSLQSKATCFRLTAGRSSEQGIWGKAGGTRCVGQLQGDAPAERDEPSNNIQPQVGEMAKAVRFRGRFRWYVGVLSATFLGLCCHRCHPAYGKGGQPRAYGGGVLIDMKTEIDEFLPKLPKLPKPDGEPFQQRFTLHGAFE